MCNSNSLDKLASSLLKTYAKEELKKANVNPAFLERTIALVEEPDDMQKVYSELLKSREKEDYLERKIRQLYMMQNVHDDEMVQLKNEVRKSKRCPENFINEIFMIIEGLLNLDTQSVGFQEELKQVQNLSSWFVSKYGYLNESEE